MLKILEEEEKKTRNVFFFTLAKREGKSSRMLN